MTPQLIITTKFHSLYRPRHENKVADAIKTQEAVQQVNRAINSFMYSENEQ